MLYICIVGIRIRREGLAHNTIMRTRINVSPTHMSINDIPDRDGHVHPVYIVTLIQSLTLMRYHY